MDSSANRVYSEEIIIAFRKRNANRHSTLPGPTPNMQIPPVAVMLPIGVTPEETAYPDTPRASGGDIARQLTYSPPLPPPPAEPKFFY